MLDFLPDFARTAIAFIVVLGVLIFFHELGHYYLEVMGDLVDGGEADDSLQRDYSALQSIMVIYAAFVVVVRKKKWI